MRIALVILSGLLAQMTFGQTRKVEFTGYRLMEYQRPVLVGDGTYNPYYRNLGETFSKGRVELNEITKTILVKWENGDDWLAKYNNKSIIKNHQDIEIGVATQATYNSRWVDDGTECEFRVLQSDKNECVIEL